MTQTPTSNSNRPGHLAEVGVPLLLWVYALVSFLPFTPSTIRIPPLEWGWMDALADAWVNHRVFGRQIVFTYGPYGFVQGYYMNPGVVWERLAVQTAMFGLIVAMMWRIGRARGTARAWVAAAIVVGLHALAYPDHWDVMAYAMLVLGLLHAGASSETDRGGIRAVEWADAGLFFGWAVTLALVMWVKFTVCVISVPFFIAVAAIWFRSSRRVAVAATGVFFSSSVGWWLVAGQPLDAMPDYFWWSANLSSGYADAMMTPATAVEIAATIGGATMLLGGIFFATASAGRFVRIVTGVAALGLIALVYRASMVRHSGFWMGMMLVMVGPFLLLLCWRRIEGLEGVRPHQRRAGRIAILVLGIVCFAIWNVPCDEITSINSLRYLVKPLRDLPDRLGALGNLVRLREVATQDFMARRPDVASVLHLAHPERLTADIFELDLRVVIGQRFAYRPRPIFQSYTAQTIENVELNRQYMAGDQAPDLVFYDSSPIDIRFPTLDDGPTWPILLCRYTPVAVLGDRYLMTVKRPKPLDPAWGRPASKETAFGQWIELAPIEKEMDAANDVVNDSATFQAPSTDGLLWCEIEYGPSLLGKVYGLAVQPIFAEMEIRLADGKVERFRLVRALAGHGFILSPAVTDREAMGTMWNNPMKPGLPGRRVAAVRICAWSDKTWAFDPAVRLRLSRLTFRPRR